MIASPSITSPQEAAWQNLHHSPTLLRAIEISYAGCHSLRILGYPSAGKEDFDELRRLLPAYPSADGTYALDAWKWTLTCPCGYCGDPTHECSCTPERVQRWRTRLSRHPFDLSLVVAIPRARDLAEVDRARKGGCEPLSLILQRGEAARAQREAVSPSFDPAGAQLLWVAVDRLFFSLSQRDRVVEVARTITALQGGDRVRAAHVAEAIQYQGCGREMVS